MKIAPFKMRVTPEQSARVQEILFKNGYMWLSGADYAHCFSYPFLYLGIALACGERQETFDGDNEPELTCEQFINLYDK